MDQCDELRFARSAPLEGERQTVPRSELSAVLDAMAQLPVVAELEAVVDASYVVKTGTRIVRALDMALRTSKERARETMVTLEPMYGCNGDLWTKFAELHIERQATMSFTWIKSHQTARMILRGQSTTRNLHGNILADAFADNAAARAQLPQDIIDWYFSARSNAFHVRRRLIAVHKSIFEFEDKHGKPDVIKVYKDNTQRRPEVLKFMPLMSYDNSATTLPGTTAKGPTVSSAGCAKELQLSRSLGSS